MPLSNPIGDISYDEYYDEMGPDNLMTISTKWSDGIISVPCGSAYEPHDYTQLAKSGMDIPPSLREEHKRVLTTPLVAASKTVRKAVAAAANGVVALDSREEIEPGAPLIRTAAFCAADDPEDWVGAVSFQCRVITGAKAKVDVIHEGTVVNPAYRRKNWGPVISGMCGQSLGYSICDHIEDQFLAAGNSKLSLSVSVRPRHNSYRYIFKSFATAVKNSFYLLDATEFHEEFKYSCWIMDAA